MLRRRRDDAGVSAAHHRPPTVDDGDAMHRSLQQHSCGDDDDYAKCVGDGLPTVASERLDDRWVPTLREWHALLDQTKRHAPPDNGLVDTPCLEWRGAAKMTYRRRRWTPQRLFYLLTRGCEPPARQPVRSACGRDACVAHIVVDRWRPPRKRPLDPLTIEPAPKTLDESSTVVVAAEYASLSLAERERLALLVEDEMRAELAHLDAIGAPPGRRIDIDAETLERVEREALERSYVHTKRQRQ